MKNLIRSALALILVVAAALVSYEIVVGGPVVEAGTYTRFFSQEAALPALGVLGGLVLVLMNRGIS